MKSLILFLVLLSSVSLVQIKNSSLKLNRINKHINSNDESINNGTLRGYTQGAHIGFDENGNKITNPRTARRLVRDGLPIYENISDRQNGRASMSPGQVDTAIARRGTPTRGGTPPVGRGGAGRMGMGLGTVGGAIMMASMLPMMMPSNPKTGEPGKFLGLDSGTASMAMMGAGTAAMLAPMIGTMVPATAAAALAGIAPVAIPLVAVLAAVTAALVIWRRSVDDSARASAELGANIGIASNSFNNMAAIIGAQTPAQLRQTGMMGISSEKVGLMEKFTL